MPRMVSSSQQGEVKLPFTNLPILLTMERFPTWAVDFYFLALQDAGFGIHDSITFASEYLARARALRGLELLDFVYGQVESHEYPLFFASFEAVFGKLWRIFYAGVQDTVRLQG